VIGPRPRDRKHAQLARWALRRLEARRKIGRPRSFVRAAQEALVVPRRGRYDERSHSRVLAIHRGLGFQPDRRADYRVRRAGLSAASVGLKAATGWFPWTQDLRQPVALESATDPALPSSGHGSAAHQGKTIPCCCGRERPGANSHRHARIPDPRRTKALSGSQSTVAWSLRPEIRCRRQAWRSRTAGNEPHRRRARRPGGQLRATQTERRQGFRSSRDRGHRGSRFVGT